MLLLVALCSLCHSSTSDDKSMEKRMREEKDEQEKKSKV